MDGTLQATHSITGSLFTHMISECFPTYYHASVAGDAVAMTDQDPCKKQGYLCDIFYCTQAGGIWTNLQYQVPVLRSLGKEKTGFLFHFSWPEKGDLVPKNLSLSFPTIKVGPIKKTLKKDITHKRLCLTH